MIQALRSFLGTNDMMAYLTMMAIRLVEMHRVLKPTGSIYLHCDPTASHYLKLVMDAIFGTKNFRNEIIWDYTFRLMELPKFFNRKHDIILFYAKSKDNLFCMPKTSWTKEEIIKTRKQAIHLGEDGVERIWMPGGRGHSKSRLVAIKEIIKRGKSTSDVWPMPIISSSAKERLGYPTQKPEALLERIISASSAKGDIVFDPFCGCGTTVSVAEKLNRKWIGIDITHLAIALMKHRLESAYGGELSPYEIIGAPKDTSSATALAEQNKYQFEWWAVSLVGARPAQDMKKGADKGIDGIIQFFDDESGQAKKIVVQVKGGHVTRNQIATLKADAEREKASISVFVTLLEPTKPMITEAAEAGFYEAPDGTQYPKLQIVTISELLDGKEIDYPRYILDITHKKAQRKSKQKIEKQAKMEI